MLCLTFAFFYSNHVANVNAKEHSDLHSGIATFDLTLQVLEAFD